MGTSINGVGSGIDIDSIVSALVSAQKTPKQSQITTQQAAATTKLSAIGSLSSALDTFQTALKNLNTASTSGSSSFAALKSASSDSSVVSASLTTGAVSGKYEIDVTSLATSSKVATQYIGSDITFESGSLTITQGDNTYNLSVQSGASLSSVRDSINNNSSLKAAGVTANIITDSTGQRLVLSSSKTGEGTDIGVSTTSTGNLGKLSIDLTKSADGSITQSKATSDKGGYVSALAADAVYTIDGLSMTSASNTVSDAISGVEFALAKADSSATITVEANTGGLSTAIKSFITAYNTLVSSINSLTKVTSTTDENGNATTTAAALASDSITRSILNGLRDELVGTSTNGGSISMLSQLGVTTQNDGTLAIDDDRLETALENNYESVQGFFTGSGGLLTRMSSSLDGYTKTNGLLDQRTDTLNDTLSDLAKQQAALDTRIKKYETTMYAKYNAMDTLVAQLNATSSSVLSTLNALNKSSSDDD